MAKANRSSLDFKTDEHAFASVGPMVSKVAGVLLTLIGILVVFQVAADILPDVFTSLADVVTALTTASTNSTIGDLLLSSLAVIIVLGVAVGIVMLLIRASGLSTGKRF